MVRSHKKIRLISSVSLMLDLDLYLRVHREIESLGLPKVWSVMLVNHLENHDDALDEAERILKRLHQGEHLVRILGWTYFSGHRFAVYEEVLMPRFDTETLIESVMLKPGDVVVDWCTGTGCVGISLALRQEAQVFLLDKFDMPCQNAKANVVNHGLGHRVQVIQSDCFEPWPFDGVDVIVANPPYIDCHDACLQDLVNDPLSALIAENHGLSFYERFLNVGGQYLRSGGQMCLEIGFNQAADVLQLAKDCGWSDRKVLKDLGGRDRVVVMRKGRL